MKEKAVRVYPAQYDAHGNLLSVAQHVLGDNLKVCSCPGCGNQRQFQGLSHAEKTNLLNES